MLLYVGLKVTIKDVDKHIYTSLLDSYKRNRYLYITKVDNTNNIVWVSYSPAGSIVEKVNTEYIEPIYDRDLSEVLREKTYKYYELEDEIMRIKELIKKSTE